MFHDSGCLKGKLGVVLGHFILSVCNIGIHTHTNGPDGTVPRLNPTYLEVTGVSGSTDLSTLVNYVLFSIVFDLLHDHTGLRFSTLPG